MKTELDIHAEIEETIFYPALEKHDETRDITLEGIEEHRIVKELLAELDAMAKDDEVWTAKMTVLKENVEHHVEEEETQLLPELKENLEPAEWLAIGDALIEAKKAAGLPVPQPPRRRSTKRTKSTKAKAKARA